MVEISTGLSLSVIVGVLLGSVLTSVLSPAGKAATRSPLPARNYRQKVRGEPALMELLERTRVSHDAAARRGEAVASRPPHN
jgi:tellurite resistance protein TerC